MKRTIFLFCLCLLLLLVTGNAYAVITSNTLLAEAQPDECFAGIGVNYPNGIAGFSPTSGPPCPAGSQNKTNRTYVWGLTRAGDSLWAGTGSNVACTTSGQFLGTIDPTLSSQFVCEYGESQPARQFARVSDQNGDWRPPQVFEYDLITRTSINRTPNDPLINQSMGFRSAGSHNGVVFMAGGSLTGSVIMFAFDANTKQYLGSRRFTGYSTIRKWLVVNNNLYTAMATQTQQGRILRWTGSRTNPFSFVVVGTVNGVPRELAEYREAGGSGPIRIAVHGFGVWVSPRLNAQGVLPATTASWRRIWTPQMYEPDPVIANTYGGGALHYFDGWLYFGTLHIPGRAAFVHSQCTANNCFGEPENATEAAELNAGAARATSIWRARNLEGAAPQIQLLYGENELPAFDPVTDTFVPTENNGGYVPLYGSSGFGNDNNAYTWTMKVASGSLFVGTLDLSGADLWRFNSSSVPAALENNSGLGDSRNYGIRTMEASADGSTLYCGMATYANLGVGAGWELRELTFE